MDFVSFERHRLKPRYLKPLPASRVLALDKIVASHQIGSSLREARAVDFIHMPSKSRLFPALDPSDLIGIRMVAEKTGEIRRFHDFLFVEEVPFVHMPYSSWINRELQADRPGAHTRPFGRPAKPSSPGVKANLFFCGLERLQVGDDSGRIRVCHAVLRHGRGRWLSGRSKSFRKKPDPLSRGQKG